MAYAVSDTDQYCKDCKRITQTVLDHRQGDTICSECGLVLEAYFVDTTAEWRTFADTENDHDPQRTGDAVNPLLHNGGLGTMISDAKNNVVGSNQSRSLGRVNKMVQKQQNPDRSLTQAFASIASKASMLGLMNTVVSRAQQIYKEADDKKFCRGRKDEALTTACLFLACQEEGFPRTLKEVATVGNGATKKEINKIKEQLKKVLEIDSKIIHAEDLTRRSCSSIGMKHQGMKAVNETLEKLKEYDIRRTPKSVLAAVMYMTVQLSNDVTSLKEVSQAADVAVGTTKKTYKDLYPYASRIIPSWFAKLEDIKKLRIP
ncbi:putative transcription factor TFIIB [Rosa chinensis]|uniref:Putative transcription factor TFIIB n=1 Tax=Rosa chinensis TaxID=74649 RepID=A0A2P6S3Z1_ROSCH|nr:transcription initiation factor IIB [Rosa chinensis]PRQ53386.1 putative transcription factor TFIIB [Rosa chinensis]